MQVIQKIKFLLHRSLISGSSDPGPGNRLRCSRNNYIKNQRNIRIIGSVSLALLFALTTFAIRPISAETSSAEATANPSTTTLTVETSDSTATLDITPTSPTGTFSSSDTSGTSLAFNVSTNNITGYNLSISHADSTTPAPLVNEDLNNSSTSSNSSSPSSTSSSDSTNSTILSSLPTGTSISDSDFNTSSYVGYYGYKPSKLNSTPNSNYIPAPTTTSTTINVTECANNTANCNTASDEYTIALGANIDYTKPAGTYTNTFILTAVANNVPYTINYLDNTGTGGTTGTDVSNLPDPESSSTATATNFKLSNITPTRTGYNFAGWCYGAVTHNATGNDTCTTSSASGSSAAGDGTIYQPDSTFSFANYTTSTNVANLYAMWNVKTYSLAITFAGTGVSSVKICKVSGNCTNDNLLGTISASGGSLAGLTYGVAYYFYPTYTSGYTLSKWAKTDTATNSALSSTTAANPTYKIGDGNGAVTITGKARSYSLTITFAGSGVSSVKVCKTAGDCSGTNLMGTVSATGGKVSGLVYKTKYYLYPVFASGYELDSWTNTGSYGTLSSTTAANPTFTMGTGNGAVTLTGKSSKLYMQDMTASQCTTTAQTVYDKRDNEQYSIQRLADGNCWLLDNLRLGSAEFANNTTALDGTNTNTTKSIPTSTFNGWNTTSGFNSYTAPMINTASVDVVPTPTYGSASNKVGVYYNYCAATMQSYCYASGSGTGNASQDVCPKGWRMPTGGSSGEYQALCDKIKGSSCDSSWSDNKAFRAALSTPRSGEFYNSSADDQGTRGNFWSSTYRMSSYMFYLRVGSSSVELQYSASRTSGFSVRCVLNDTRTISDVSDMQDVNSAVVTNTAEGATATLRDSRDNQEYTVAKIDGNLWMTRNLAIGCNGSSRNTVTLTSSDSNVSSDYTISSSDVPNFNSSNNLDASGYITAAMMCSSNSSYGAWYNYKAATAGTITGSSNSTAATNDICPAGWRLPTRSEQSGITSSSSAFSPVTGGDYYGGSILNTGDGFWWSATASNSTYRYYLHWNGSSLNTSSGDRLVGFYVRCIRSS